MNWDATPAQKAIYDFLREPIILVRDESGNVLLTLEQAALYLGISKKKLAALSGNSARGGQISKLKVGRLPFYQREELDRYLENHLGLRSE